MSKTQLCKRKQAAGDGLVFSLLTVLLLFLTCSSLSAQDLAKARELEKAGDRERALAQYEEWLKKNQGAPDYFSVLLHTADIVEDQQRALTLLREAQGRAKGEERRAVLLKLASLSEMLGLIDEAALAYYNAFFVVPPTEDYGMILKAAHLYVELGDYPKARSIGKIVLTASQNPRYRAQAAVLLSRIHLVEDETDEAVELVLPLLDLKGIGPDTLLWAHALGYYAGNKGLEDRAFILLKQDYPDSMELAILDQRVEFYPSPLNYLGVLPPLTGPIGEKKQTDEKAGGVKTTETSLIMIQTGSFIDKENAEYMVKDLKRSGFNPEITQSIIKGKTYFKVVIPSIPENELQKHLVLLKEKGFEGYPIYEEAKK